MSSISVQPGVGTAPVNFAVVVLPSGIEASARVPIASAGVGFATMSDASAQAFAAAAQALLGVLSPRLPAPQSGPFFFGFP